MAASAKKTVAISGELYDRLAAMKDRTGAETVDELVGRVLRDWMSKEGAGSSQKEVAIPPEDEKMVEERLKSLGYM